VITDHTKCNFSTGIDEQLTAGQGKLDENGFWEFPCPECEDRMNGFLAEDCGAKRCRDLGCFGYCTPALASEERS
jgi:hypothetical protein